MQIHLPATTLEGFQVGDTVKLNRPYAKVIWKVIKISPAGLRLKSSGGKEYIAWRPNELIPISSHVSDTTHASEPSTPTTKDGRTLQDLISEMRRHAIEFGGMDISTAEVFEQAIEELIAERERLAELRGRIDQVKRDYQAGSRSKQGLKIMLTKLTKLQAQSKEEVK